MTVLDSGLASALLPSGELPQYAPHHRAKHELLRRYMAVWLPKLGFSYGQVALVDGFSGAGRYRTGEKGSPLLMLDAYLGRSSKDRARFTNGPHFVFIETKKSFACHLKAEVARYKSLHGATVDVVHGSYEDHFPSVITHLSSVYRQPVPLFAFVDPRGYKNNPFEHIADFKAKMPRKSEVMVYLPASFMARFIRTGRTDAALTKLYGGPTWEEAAKLDVPSRRRAGAKLAELFGQRLGEHFDWVTSFNVDPERRNDYYLLFATDHRDGLRAMKRGMWKIDNQAGTGFRQPKVRPGQGVLFGSTADSSPPNMSVLEELLRSKFEQQAFTIDEAESYTLCHTSFLDRPHLRRWALRPLEKAGQIEIVRSSRRRKGDYPPGTKLRFIP